MKTKYYVYAALYVSGAQYFIMIDKDGKQHWTQEFDHAHEFDKPDSMKIDLAFRRRIKDFTNGMKGWITINTHKHGAWDAKRKS